MIAAGSWIARFHGFVLVLVCALALGGCSFGTPVSLLDDEEAVAKAISGIESRYSGPVPAFRVVIGDSEMVFQARDPVDARQISEWRLVREQYHFLNYDRVYGPTKVDGPVNRRNFEGRLFNLKEANFAAWGKIADAAVARAGLREKGGVSAIELLRPAAALPSKSGSPVRWTVEVRSTLETVRVHANGDGEIVRVAVVPPEGTPVDLHGRPELVGEAVAEMRHEVGGDPVIRQVYVHASSIGFTTTLKVDATPGRSPGRDRTELATFNWTPQGLREGGSTIDTGSMFSNSDAPFSLDDIDWTLLPKVLADAREALAMPNGRIYSIQAHKPTDIVGAPVALWKIDLEDGRERGTYFAGPKGAMRRVVLPESRRKKVDWLDPDVIASTMQRIGAEFGPDIRYDSITIHDTFVTIVAQDPRKPSDLTEVQLRDTGFSRFGTVMFPGRPERRFRMEDMRLSGDQWRTMIDQTLDMRKLPSGSLSRVTIGRQDQSFRGVPIEFRAESRGVGSMTVYEAKGAQVQRVRP